MLQDSGGPEHPSTDQSVTALAESLSRRYATTSPNEQRKQFGQFFTPLPVARFMAGLTLPTRPIRTVLDPGAGTGILSIAFCESLPKGHGHLHIDAWEIDRTLAELCAQNLDQVQQKLAKSGTTLSFTVHRKDFVLENAHALEPGLFSDDNECSYDLAISNPPYFKLQKTDPRAIAAGSVVHGQPNIYALFLAIMASRLRSGGEMITITPRSFAAGEYFRRFRELFFSLVTPESVHLFDSRTEAFRDDDVLQESVILRLRRGPTRERPTVRVSTCHGPADIQDRASRDVPLDAIIDRKTRNPVFHIPTHRDDDEIIDFVRSWRSNLHQLDLEISTGPVVPFRTHEALLDEAAPGDSTAPLLWLQHIRPTGICWPIPNFRKPQIIRSNAATRHLLLRNSTYVLTRRFTAKEEARRLTVAPLYDGELPGDLLGFENHLNYIHRQRGRLLPDEAAGLAAVLGSRLLDRFFRISNGNTQVSATEIRRIPLPSAETISTIGKLVRDSRPPQSDSDGLVERTLDIPSRLAKILEKEPHVES